MKLMNQTNIIRVYFDQIRLTWRLFRDRRVALWMKVVGALPIVYLIFPIDVIPDFIPLLGQLDDIAILFAGMRLFESIVPAYIAKEHRAAIALHDLPKFSDIIPGRARKRDNGKA